MKKFIPLLLIMWLLSACRKPDPVALPVDTIDQYTGLTFIRQAGKDAASGKDVYHYVEFVKNSGIDRYVRLNATETPTSLEHGTYRQTNTKSFIFTFPSESVPAELINNGIVLTTSTTNYTYTKK